MILKQGEVAEVGHFVYTSSTSVYGRALEPVDRAIWVDEQFEVAPRDIYDETKLAAEALVASAGFSTTVLRVAHYFAEAPHLTALHHLYRGVGASDVARARVASLERADVRGIFNVAGPLIFERVDCVHLLGNESDVD